MSFTKTLVVFVVASGSAVPARAEQIVVESVLIRLIDDVNVAARVEGVLAQVEVTEGQVVKSNTRLAQVDKSQAVLLRERAVVELQIAARMAADDLAVRQAQRSLTYHRSDAGRLEHASVDSPGSVSKKQLDEAQFLVDQAEFELQSASRDLENARSAKGLKEHEVRLANQNLAMHDIVAPLNGVVAEVARRPGEWVKAGDRVVRIIRIDRLRAEGFVSSADAERLVPGMTAVVTANTVAGASSSFTGKIVFISPEVNPVNGKVHIWAEIESSDGALKPGLRATMVATP